MWTLAKPKVGHMLALVAFLSFVSILQYIVTLNGEDYVEAKRFVEQDPRLELELGKVMNARMNFWAGFSSVSSSATGHTNYSFSVVTSQGTFDIDIHLRKSTARWYVETADVRDREGKQTRIRNE